MTTLSSFLDAVARDDVEAVHAALAKQPELARGVDANGATALHHAAFDGRADIIDELLHAGADVNARDGKFGATPGGWALHRLRERGALLAVEIDDVLFALDRGDDVWVHRLVTRHPALKAARDRDGRSLATHPRVRATPSLSALFDTAGA